MVTKYISMGLPVIDDQIPWPQGQTWKRNNIISELSGNYMAVVIALADGFIDVLNFAGGHARDDGSSCIRTQGNDLETLATRFGIIGAAAVWEEKARSLLAAWDAEPARRYRRYL